MQQQFLISIVLLIIEIFLGLIILSTGLSRIDFFVSSCPPLRVLCDPDDSTVKREHEEKTRRIQRALQSILNRRQTLNNDIAVEVAVMHQMHKSFSPLQVPGVVQALLFCHLTFL